MSMVGLRTIDRRSHSPPRFHSMPSKLCQILEMTIRELDETTFDSVISAFQGVLNSPNIDRIDIIRHKSDQAGELLNALNGVNIYIFNLYSTLRKFKYANIKRLCELILKEYPELETFSSSSSLPRNNEITILSRQSAKYPTTASKFTIVPNVQQNKQRSKQTQHNTFHTIPDKLYVSLERTIRELDEKTFDVVLAAFQDYLGFVVVNTIRHKTDKPGEFLLALNKLDIKISVLYWTLYKFKYLSNIKSLCEFILIKCT